MENKTIIEEKILRFNINKNTLEFKPVGLKSKKEIVLHPINETARILPLGHYYVSLTDAGTFELFFKKNIEGKNKRFKLCTIYNNSNLFQMIGSYGALFNSHLKTAVQSLKTSLQNNSPDIDIIYDPISKKIYVCSAFSYNEINNFEREHDIYVFNYFNEIYLNLLARVDSRVTKENLMRFFNSSSRSINKDIKKEIYSISWGVYKGDLNNYGAKV